MTRLLIILTLVFAAQSAPAQDVYDGLRDEGEGFAQVVPGKRLEFPRDHGAHPEYRIEWWYLTSNLVDRQGRHWGLQWTLFRNSMSPQPMVDGWHSNQVWMAHAAITTPDGHYHEQRYARGGIGQAGVTSIRDDGYFNAWLDDWEWRSSDAALFPAELKITVGDREILMQLESDRKPVANGIEGYSQKSAQGQASYYYSQPHIRVRGHVSGPGGRTELSGQGWLDREWSSQALAPNQQGWDWFSLHLDDGYKLMVYQLRHDDGNHWMSGNWIGPAGKSKRLGADAIELESTRIGEIDIGNNETRAMPMEWRITLTGQNRRLRVRPLYDQQWMDTNFPYWEGVVLVEHENGGRAGIGYMELTGYQ